MKIGENGFVVWMIRLVGMGGILSIVFMLMAQSKSEGIQTKSISVLEDRNTLMEERIEKRDEKFDKFLMQQTRKALLDSVNNATLMQFLAKQLEFNGVVQEHIIKENN